MERLITWRQSIDAALADAGERWDDVERCTLTEAELDANFCSSYGTSEGKPFTAWTANRVYFPVVYDGAEWVESVPRHPCGEATIHVGGQ